MSREIKFRAWDGEKFISPLFCGLFWYKDFRDMEDGIPFKCEPEQYTGLKDKNGVEIYEGDVLYCKGWSPEYEPVVYKNGIFFCNKRGQPLGYFICDDYGTFAQVEVCGNIHQNPELLEK